VAVSRLPADKHDDFARLKAQRRSFSTAELSEDRVRAIATSRMDRKHEHLNALLDAN
jgi:hypothetical protein